MGLRQSSAASFFFCLTLLCLAWDTHAVCSSIDSRQSRMFLIQPDGANAPSEYIVPGYYTVVIYSASWCPVCKGLREQIRQILPTLPHVVVVDLDVTKQPEMPELTFVPSFLNRGENITLPAALFFDPVGTYINAKRDAPRAPPVNDPDKVLRNLKRLKLKSGFDPVRRSCERQVRRLEALEATTGHYAARPGSGGDRPISTAQSGLAPASLVQGSRVAGSSGTPGAVGADRGNHWLVASLTVALSALAVGIVTGYASSSSADRFNTSIDRADKLGLKARAETYSQISKIAYAVGGTALVTGIVIWTW